jgi:UDP-3-O-[3-hydroxymyristoyl] glucosamine N-acyltransferase
VIKALTLGELAAHVGGRVIGDPTVSITSVAAIDEAGDGAITVLSNPRYRRYLRQCRASAVIVAPGGAAEGEGAARINYLETTDPYRAFARILGLFCPPPQFSRTVSSAAFIDGSAVLAADVTVYPNVYIGARARIGGGSTLFPGVFIGDDAEIGADCLLHPNVVIREGCRVGDRVILHPGVVIGSDGFGYAGAGANRIKIPQIGIVEVGDDVEIGANTTIDRATLGKTIIGRGVKIDNLVQVGHNVTVGDNSLFAAQVGIAGSTRVGRDVTLAGQVGVAQHLEIGDGATVGPKSGVGRTIEPRKVVSGFIDAAPHQEWLKVAVLLPQLPGLWRAVKRLEKQLARLLKAAGKEIDGDVGR